MAELDFVLQELNEFLDCSIFCILIVNKLNKTTQQFYQKFGLGHIMFVAETSPTPAPRHHAEKEMAFLREKLCHELLNLKSFDKPRTSNHLQNANR